MCKVDLDPRTLLGNLLWHLQTGQIQSAYEEGHCHTRQRLYKLALKGALARLLESIWQGYLKESIFRALAGRIPTVFCPKGVPEYSLGIYAELCNTDVNKVLIWKKTTP